MQDNAGTDITAAKPHIRQPNPANQPIRVSITYIATLCKRIYSFDVMHIERLNAFNKRNRSILDCILDMCHVPSRLYARKCRECTEKRASFYHFILLTLFHSHSHHIHSSRIILFAGLCFSCLFLLFRCRIFGVAKLMTVHFLASFFV